MMMVRLAVAVVVGAVWWVMAGAGEGHTGLWSMWRWYLTHRYGKFKNEVESHYV